MLVHQVLAGKATAGVLSLPGDALVSEAAQMLTENRIGTVLVSKDGATADGILSERDIVRELAVSGSGCLGRPVSAYMTRDLVTCQLSTNTREILRQMTEGRFRHMPVIDDKRVVGLISLGDVVKAELQQLAMEKDALEGMIMGH
jgi:CBS domain-containing protein